MRRKNRSILGKMIVGISVPVLLVMGGAGALILSNVNKTVSDLSEERLISDSKAAAYQVSDFFTKYMSGAEQAAANLQFEEFLEDNSDITVRLNQAEGYDEIKISLDKMAAADMENIQAAWVGDFDTSQITQSDNFNSAPGWDITSRPWYAVKSTGKPVLTEPYIDASTGNLIVTAAAPVFCNEIGEVIGAIGYDISLTQLIRKMEAYRIGESGFLILCTADGQVVYHPDSGYIGRNVAETDLPDEVINAFSRGVTGSLQYQANGEEYFGSMNQVSSSGWYVMSCIPMSEVMASYYSALRLIITIFGAGLILLLLIIVFISKGISNPIKKLGLISDRIAEGDLKVDINVKSSDETGLVAEAMEKTVKRLSSYIDYIEEISAVLNQIAVKDLVFELKYDYTGEFSKVKESLLNIRQTLTATLKQITRTSAEVAAGADHISSGAQNMAQGATEQASSVEELAAVVADITSHVKGNASDADSAAQMVKKTAGELTAGNRQMQRLREAMADLNDNSSEIGKVIKTIEDIAFQTNILALNAAVEAARAGDAGKGFAVVADEVRNLASKSSDAAKETTEMIESSMRSIQAGKQLTDEMADTMLKLVADSDMTADAMKRISEASVSLSEAIFQVSMGIDQISGVVQDNSATAEESAAASEELSSQSQLLNTLVNEFHI
ncbi:MAG: methyl-accepting chemotaxis protein [Clostridiales bacterium]|nr:methyl-accepting chemotaxis protein [Clostridiales bacterium]